MRSNEISNSKSLNIIDLSNYELLRLITKETSYEIYEVLDKNTNRKFSAKIYTTSELDDDSSKDNFSQVKKFSNEIEILNDLNSPFVVKYIGFNYDGFKEKPGSVIIMENVSNGNLYDLINAINSKSTDIKLSETKKLMVIFSIALGILHIHDKGIILRCLRLTSIYLDDFLLPKIGNFELATKSAGISDDISFSLGIGGMKFVAPEIIDESEFDQSADVYSFGIALFVFLTGEYPKITFKDTMQGKKIPINDKVSQQYKNLIYRCTELDPTKRPSLKEIISLLKTDKSFISEEIDEEEFLNFVRSVESPENKPSFNFEQVHIEYPVIRELLIEIDQIDLSIFEKKEFIGKGQFGEVYKVKEKNTTIINAAKINKIEIEESTQDEIQCLTQEINILSKFNSLLILKFIGYNQKNFENESCPTIITEFCQNDSLEKIIELQIHGISPPEWNDTKILISAYGIAAGMSELHSKNIIHCDLKPGNIFYDEYLLPKIGDFGLSMELKNDLSINEINCKGTPAFMSPEIFDSYTYSKASDVYAYSCLLYQMITLKKPFEGLNFFQLIRNVSRGTRPLLDYDIPNCYKKLIERCWQNDPCKRPTFDEIVHILENDEEFITQSVDAVEYYDYIDNIKDKRINSSQFHRVDIDYSELNKIQKRYEKLNIPYVDINKFTKQRLIRRIDFYNIYEIKSKETSGLYEAKISTLSTTKMSKNDIIHLSREINFLTKLRHPSFLKFIGYSPIDFTQQLNPTIITEITPNKSLEQLLYALRNDEYFEEWNDTKKLINIYGIASGMSFLHFYNVIHRNLSPESIFLDEYLFPKIGDFGLLKKIHTIESMTYQTTIGIKGKLSYLSPEILEMNEYSKSSDVYAFAMIVYEIITQEIPFENINNLNKLFDEVVINTKRPNINTNIPEKYRQLIEMCWSQNPNERPSFQDITSILKKDAGFLTKNVNTEIFMKYVHYIEETDHLFYSQNRDVKIDDITSAKQIIKKDEVNQSNNNESINGIIDQYIFEHDTTNMIQYLHKNCSHDLTNSILDKIYLTDNPFYTLLVNEGASIGNPVCIHKLAISFIYNHQRSNNMNNYKKACEILDQSIKQGFVLSYFTKARLLHEVFGQDESAYQVAKEGSEKGDKYSTFLIGYFIMRGIGIKKNNELGISTMINSGCDDYYKRFATDIAIYYSIHEDEKKSFEWFQIAFNNKKTSATINNLGICYLIGNGVTKNILMAEKIFKLGVLNEDPHSFYHLGFIFELRNDNQKALELYKEAAKRGETNAQARFSYLLKKHKNNDISKIGSIEFICETTDLNASLEKNIKSAENGNIDTQIYLAKKFSYENDAENTHKYMKMCIKSGKYIEPLEYAVQLYNKGYFTQALYFFQMISEINNPIAKFYIGIMTFRGYGCQKDIIKAYKIMKELADKNIDKATEFLKNNYNSKICIK